MLKPAPPGSALNETPPEPHTEAQLWIEISPTVYTLALTYRLGGPTARLTPFDIHAGPHSVLAHIPQPVSREGR